MYAFEEVSHGIHDASWGRFSAHLKGSAWKVKRDYEGLNDWRTVENLDINELRSKSLLQALDGGRLLVGNGYESGWVAQESHVNLETLLSLL